MEGQLSLLCKSVSPSGTHCGRPAGHGITLMTLAGERKSYVGCNERPDGNGEGWRG